MPKNPDLQNTWKILNAFEKDEDCSAEALGMSEQDFEYCLNKLHKDGYLAYEQLSARSMDNPNSVAPGYEYITRAGRRFLRKYM